MRRSTIMVVDDNETDLEILTHLLHLTHPSVDLDLTTCALAALSKLKKRSCSVLLTDYRMPHINGLDVLREATAMRPEVPVLLMSGHLDHEIVTAAIAAGAFDCIGKPFRCDEFQTTVGSALQVSRLRREVKSRQLHLVRMRRQLDTWRNSIGAIQGEVPPASVIKNLVIASRQLVENSTRSILQSADRVSRRYSLAEHALRVSESHLRAALVHAQSQAFRRTTGLARDVDR
jgi:FixJ family two-component response regulator